ncbi:MAG: outer membrane lipid asymmetry maintenance protein MlaD [Candidatus Paracaedibacteraceae bacterium]|nr:outer membrane lipid asymmetry maintenance protein MlaD [Candidatus Paracaedibacteraceae bacterium]
MLNKSNNIIETLLGIFVVLVAAYFAYFAYSSGQAGRSFKGYTISAKFMRIDGLHVGSDVKISGVKIGTIKSLEIDPKTYQANVVLYIDGKLKIPTDSSAAVVSEGLLGGKYIAIEPGADSEVLANKGIIMDTESSVNFETLLNKFLFSKSEEENVTKKNNHKESNAEEDVNKTKSATNESPNLEIMNDSQTQNKPDTDKSKKTKIELNRKPNTTKNETNSISDD